MPCSERLDGTTGVTDWKSTWSKNKTLLAIDIAAGNSRSSVSDGIIPNMSLLINGWPQVVEVYYSFHHPSSFVDQAIHNPYSTIISTLEDGLSSSLPRPWWPFCRPLENPVPRSVTGPRGCRMGMF